MFRISPGSRKNGKAVLRFNQANIVKDLERQGHLHDVMLALALNREVTLSFVVLKQRGMVL